MDESLFFLPSEVRFLCGHAGSALRGKSVRLRGPVLRSAGPVVDGLRFRAARLQLGYTQQMLADFACVGIATIQRAERGRLLRPDTVHQLCRFFSDRFHRSVTPEELGLAVAGDVREGECYA